jgi:hypothetical protein
MECLVQIGKYAVADEQYAAENHKHGHIRQQR